MRCGWPLTLEYGLHVEIADDSKKDTHSWEIGDYDLAP